MSTAFPFDEKDPKYKCFFKQMHIRVSSSFTFFWSDKPIKIYAQIVNEN